jgi:hypothetical protein
MELKEALMRIQNENAIDIRLMNLENELKETQRTLEVMLRSFEYQSSINTETVKILNQIIPTIEKQNVTN